MAQNTQPILGPWTPECWHKGSDQLIAEARAQNERAFDVAVASGEKHTH